MRRLRPIERVQVMFVLVADEATRQVRAQTAERRTARLERWAARAVWRLQRYRRAGRVRRFFSRNPQRRTQAALGAAGVDRDQAMMAAVLRRVQLLSMVDQFAELDYSSPEDARSLTASFVTPEHLAEGGPMSWRMSENEPAALEVGQRASAEGQLLVDQEEPEPQVSEHGTFVFCQEQDGVLGADQFGELEALGPEPVSALEDPGAEARDVLLADYAEHGTRVLFTGLGGDEAMKLRAPERERFGVRAASPLRQRDGAPAFLGPFGRELPPHRFEGAAPIGPTLWSILDCFGALYPQHMRHGIWPINPFAAPEVVRLAESLPCEWRHRERLLRDRLTRCGFSQDVSHPKSPENFQGILDTAMRRHGADLLLEVLDRGSLLVEDGCFGADELTCAATAFKATGSRMFDVYRPLILETGLASLQARR